MTTHAFRMEICGGIATGKTTLARQMVEHHGGTLVLEDFRSNPFWKRFYTAPHMFFREKNICFLAQHAGEIKAATDADVICDYAVVQDLAYSSLSGDASHQALMEQVYADLYLPQQPPRLIVHLVCDEDIQLRRIRQRGRREEAPITVDYLRRLNEALTATLVAHERPCPVVVVRSDDIDFVQDLQATQSLTQRLRDLSLAS
jgi:deoxyguanosine kinase